MAWTVEQVLALAPDAASARAGRELAQPRRWSALGADDDAAWGECQGSGSLPYRAAVLTGEPAFRCTCPSRKIPCKHTIALFLLLVEAPGRFAAGDRPTWVEEWVAGRAKRAQPKAPVAPKPAAAERDPVAEAAATARADQRQARVAAGLDELQLWLGDLVRHGLAQAGTQPPRFWATAAARLVDAQAPGVARRLQAAASLVAARGQDWPDRLLEQVALIHLLGAGFERLADLPEPVREDLRTAIGWTQSQDALLAEPGVRDRWLSLGRRVEVEERLRAQRTWLWGERTRRAALVLDFAFGAAPLDVSLLPGAAIEAELVFYPGAVPLRALVKARHGQPEPIRTLPGYRSIDEAVAAWSAALAACPWLDRFPMPLAEAVPVASAEGWRLHAAGREGGPWLPVAPRFDGGWRLLALSGGHPVSVFGEWDGRRLLPLSAVAHGRYVSLVAEGETR